MKYVTLNNGVKMPQLGYGVYQVTKEYLAYLDSLHISWIVCGETHIDLHKAVEILYTEFGVERIRTEVAGTELVHLVANYAQFLLIQADFFADGSCAVWHVLLPPQFQTELIIAFLPDLQVIRVGKFC